MDMTMTRNFCLMLLVWGCCMALHAQDGFVAHKKEVANGYNFWLYRPKNEADSVRCPLVVFLHGASLCGTNMNKVKRYGPMEAMRMGLSLNCYLMAPQNPGGAWHPEKVMNTIEWAVANCHVDSSRIYVLGMSLGGYGTLDVCATYPDRIAAGMALCGGATVKDLSGLARMPLWVVHGTADRDVPVSASDRVVSAVKATGDGTRLIYTRMQGVDHGRPARVFYLSQTYDWLFSHSLEDEGRPVNRDYDITPRLLQGAYRSLQEKR